MNHLLVRLLLWPITLLLCPIPVTLLPRSFAVEVLESVRPAPLPVDFFVTPSPAFSVTTSAALPPTERTLGRARRWTERVLVYLQKAEVKETNPHFQTDYRIAWTTAKWAQAGVPEWAWLNDTPYVAATFQALQCRPEEVWPRIVANRKQKLGAEYSQWYDANDNLLPEVSVCVKKPCVSERRRLSSRVSSRERAA